MRARNVRDQLSFSVEKLVLRADSGRVEWQVAACPYLQLSNPGRSQPPHALDGARRPRFPHPPTLVKQANCDFTVTCQSKTHAETWIEGTQKLTTLGGVPLGYTVTPLCANTLEKKTRRRLLLRDPEEIIDYLSC